MMVVAALTFAGVLLLVVGLYWAFVAWPEQKAQAALKKRMRPSRGQPSGSVSVVQRTKTFSDISSLNVAFGATQGLQGLATGLQNLIDASGLPLTVGRFVLLSGCSAAALFLLVNWYTSTVLVPLLVGFFSLWLPFIVVRYKANSRLNRFEELFPEAIGLIIRSLRAGHAFTTGLATVAEEIAQPVGPEFRILYDHQNFGMPLDEALKALARRIPLLDVQFFVTAVLTQREAGGNLAEVLENIASVVRDRFKVKRQVRVVTAHARMTGSVLVVMPLVAAAGFQVLAPDHLALLWRDPLGVKMLVAAIVLQILGAMIVRRLVRIEY